MGSTSPSKDELSQLVRQLNAAIDQYRSAAAGQDEWQRMQALKVAHEVISELGVPRDALINMAINWNLTVSMELCFDWGVFQAIPQQGSITYADLAAKVDAEVGLLTRVLSIVVASGILKQVGDDAVESTPKVDKYLEASPILRVGFENMCLSYSHMPQYFAKYGRKEPKEMTHVPYSFSYGTPEKNFYEIIYSNEERRKVFNKPVSSLDGMVWLENMAPIEGVYDYSWVVEYAQKHPDSDRDLFVDIGGSRGQAIKAICRQYPDLPRNRCVLEDRADVLASVESMGDEEFKEVKKEVCNFHDGQPVKGALVYFIRGCLHNYGDEVSTKILSGIVEAMADNSKLLVMEQVHTDPPNIMDSMADMMMMSCGGKERTVANWEKVVGGAGLEINGISRGKGSGLYMIDAAVIECVKV